MHGVVDARIRLVPAFQEGAREVPEPGRGDVDTVSECHPRRVWRNLQPAILLHLLVDSGPDALHQCAARVPAIPQHTSRRGQPFDRGTGIVAAPRVTTGRRQECLRLRLDEGAILRIRRRLETPRGRHGAPLVETGGDLARVSRHQVGVERTQGGPDPLIARKQIMVVGEGKPCLAIEERRVLDGVRGHPESPAGDPQAHETFDPGGAQIAKAIVLAMMMATFSALRSSSSQRTNLAMPTSWVKEVVKM